jgi:hypothetical protein
MKHLSCIVVRGTLKDGTPVSGSQRLIAADYR